MAIESHSSPKNPAFQGGVADPAVIRRWLISALRHTFGPLAKLSAITLGLCDYCDNL